MNGRAGTEPTGQDAECAALALTGRPEGRRQLAAVTGEPDRQRPSGWEPSSVQSSGVRAARAALLALAPLTDTSRQDRALVDRAAHIVDGLTDRELLETLPHLPALCWAELDLDRFDAAHGHLDRAIAGASRIRHRALLPGLFLASAVVAGRQGRLADAVRDAQESAARADQLGRADERAFALAVSLPAQLWRHGPSAVRGPLAAVPAPQTLPVAWWRPVAAAGWVEALLQLDQAAAASSTAAIVLAMAAGHPGTQYPSLLALAATAELACGRTSAAGRLQRRAGSVAEAGGLDYQCGTAGLARARVLLSGGAPTAAMAAAAAAAARFDRCGATLDAGRARLVAAAAATVTDDHDRAGHELRRARSALLASGAHWLASTATATATATDAAR